MSSTVRSKVRSLLKEEHAARRVQHESASYSSSGARLCQICKQCFKTDSSWDNHLRSAAHTAEASRVQDLIATDDQYDASTVVYDTGARKRKSSDDGAESNSRKRRIVPGNSNASLILASQTEQIDLEAKNGNTKLGGSVTPRPASTLRPTDGDSSADIDEDQWAAFEADVASLKAPIAADAVIAAPAMTATKHNTRDNEVSNARQRGHQEAETEGDKEEAARKLEVEFEEIERLQAKVRRLRVMREALRSKIGTHQPVSPAITRSPIPSGLGIEDDDSQDEENQNDDINDDEWDCFRLRS